MSELETTTIAELAEVNPKVDIKRLKDDALVSFIPMSDVTESGRWVNHQERRLDAARLGYTPFADGDVLFAKITPCMENGKGVHAIGLKNGVGFGSTEFHVLRTRGETSARYLFHWLQARQTRTRAIAYMGGSAGQQRVQSDFFANFRVFKLDAGEQSRIAAVLDTIGELIAKMEAVIAKLRQVRAGLLHDLLTRGLDQHGQIRDPITHPELFQDSPLGLIPKDWEVPSLGEALSMKAGYALTSDHISVEGAYPVYGGNGVRGFTTRYTHDGCYAIIGRQGALCGNIVLASGKFFATEHAVVCTQVKKVSAGWLACYLSRMNLNRFSESSAQPGLSVQKISHQKIALPRIEEQIAIESLLNAADKSLDAEEIEMAKIMQLKSGLTTDLLTGRVRVKVGVAA